MFAVLYVLYYTVLCCNRYTFRVFQTLPPAIDNHASPSPHPAPSSSCTEGHQKASPIQPYRVYLVASCCSSGTVCDTSLQYRLYHTSRRCCYCAVPSTYVCK